ncbi:neuraminidase-like domain-containing protein [Dyadobacter sp. CY261]|uniref:Tc toxin subunit A-related protein n=1 Tax=Dyadobacter sp. CY261 TaxID=2907203 RepID=UPI001EEBE47E|nr:neuraminidase-like domain-containing protein [Dyadobacter sp. CY261]
MSEEVANLQRVLLALRTKLPIIRQIPQNEIDENRAGEQTLTAVMSFQKEHRIEYPAGLVVDQPTADLLNKIAKDFGLFEQDDTPVTPPVTPPPTWTIRGKITLPDGKPAVKLNVSAIDRDFRKEQSLGSAVTGLDGKYVITYNPAKFEDTSEKYTADVYIQVVSDKNILGESSVHYNVPSELVIDFRLDKAPVYATSEFERIDQEILPIIKDVRPETLTKGETDKTDDFGFLSNETGIARELIEFWSQAYQNISMQMGIDLGKKMTWVYYAWLRIPYIPRSFDQILLQPTQELVNQIESAIRQNYIPEIRKPDLAILATAIEEARNRAALRQRFNSGGTYQDYMQIASTDFRFQLDLMHEIWNSSDFPQDAFWERTGKIASISGKPNELRLAKTVFAVGSVVDSSATVGILISNHQIRELRALTKFETADWRSFLTEAYQSSGKSAVPEYITDEKEEDRVDSYAIELHTRLKNLFPTDYFQKSIQVDSAATFKDDWQIFFKNNPHFEFGKQPMSLMLVGDKKSLNLDGLADSNRFTQHLLSTAKLLPLAKNDYRVVDSLQRMGFHSAFHIAPLAPRVFVEKMIKTVPESEAIEILQQATSKVMATLNFYAKMTGDNDIETTVTGSSTAPDGSPATIDLGNGAKATWAELFGSLEEAECDECMSILSPAAYLVDLLQYLKSNAEDVYSALLNRRPDLAYIDLTCDNTNTTLPYIDLVIEILETLVQHNSLQKSSSQTTLAAESLSVFPEHVDPDAYEALKSQVYPASLPFNLEWEQTRLYLGHLGVDRYKLIDHYAPESPDKQVAIAADYLGLSPEEAKIITDADANNLYRFYGFESENVTDKDLGNFALLDRPLAGRNWMQAMSENVDLFLFKTEISYRDLLTLLSTRFVRTLPGQDVTIENKPGTEPTTAKLDELQLIGLNPSHWNRIYRFIRLWKRLGWTMYDLDRMMWALPELKFDIHELLIITFYKIEKVRDQLSLNVEEMSFLLNGVDNDQDYKDFFAPHQPTIPTLFDKTYGNVGLGAKVFKDPGPDFNYAKIAADKKYVASVCQISEEQVSAIVGKDKAGDLIDLAACYKAGLLSKALQFPADEIIAIWNLFPGEPGSVEILGNVVEFAAELLFCGLTFKKFNDIVTSNFFADEEEVTNCYRNIRLQVFDMADHDPNSSENIIIKQREKSLKKVVTTNLNELFSFKETGINSLISEEQWALLFAGFSQGSKVKEDILTVEVDKEFKNAVNALHGKIAFLRLRPFEPEHLVRLTTAKVFNFSGDATIPDYDIAVPALKEWTKILKIFDYYNNEPKKWNGFVENLSTNHVDSEIEKIREEKLLKLLGDHESENLGLLVKLASNHTITEKELAANAEKENVRAVKSAAQAKYTEAQWLKVAKPIQDLLRQKQRDALTDFVLFKLGSILKALDRNELYERLLIDPEMQPIMQTSRIVLAISSVQLFIERVLMGLEEDPKVNPADGTTPAKLHLPPDASAQWNKWRKWYRVWEANRKIFLYPENWIEPELRDNKTPFFEEFETQLSQNAVTSENAEKAFQDYFNKLESVGKLEIIAQYHEKANPDAKGTLHVFGRTYSEPRQYFYRKQLFGEWTGWEKVDLDIEGDAMTPVVWNGELYLFWFNFMKKTEEADNTIRMSSVKGEGTEPDQTQLATQKPETYFELRLVWSRYEQRKWVARKRSKEYLKLPIGTSTSELLETLTKKEIGLFLIEEGSAIGIRTKGVGSSQFSVQKATDVFNDLSTEYFGIGSDETDLLFAIPTSSTGNLTTFGEGGYWFGSPPDYIYELVYTKGDKALSLLKVPKIYNKKRSVALEPNFPFTKDPEAVFFNDSQNSMLLRPNLTPGMTIGFVFYGFLTVRTHLSHFDSEIFYHPYLIDIRKRFTGGLDNLWAGSLREDSHTQNLNKSAEILSAYEHTNGIQFERGRSEFGKMDFSYKGAYSMYNWELFFHIPISIACRLSQNQKFDEARKWFHYVFDPTIGESGSKERFWRFSPFFKEAESRNITLQDIIDSDTEQIDKWQNNPFQPHVIARMRVTAYMKFTVMKYLDNLINWADMLFRRDSMESINEAAMLYILAAKILGRRPQLIPPRAYPKTQRFDSLVLSHQLGLAEELAAASASPINSSNTSLDGFSNALVEIGSFVFPNKGAGKMNYFCTPRNPKLLGYWDTVSDRLYKIRNSLNIEGMLRKLPLFELPIDPAGLVKDTKMGRTLDQILSDTSNARKNRYRFQVMLQKAQEFASEVRSLGGALLVAFEKRDSEELALLRSSNEQQVLKAIWDIKKKQVDEALLNVESLGMQLENVEQRISYYSELYKNEEPTLIAEESNQLLKLESQKYFYDEMILNEIMASVYALIPDIKIGSPPTIGGSYGGSHLSSAMKGSVSIKSYLSQKLGLEASKEGLVGSYKRRNKEWKLQLDSAKKEKEQLTIQILASENRAQIAEKELSNHELQIEQSQALVTYMREKFSNQQLYHWMQNELSTLYFQSYQMAYEMAKQAEQSYFRDLNLEAGSTPGFINYVGWNSLSEAMLVGEKLTFDLRRMEKSFLEKNTREYELTKHVSLAMYFPLSVINLRVAGSCSFHLDKALFDLDFVHHHKRRIKSISISMPCIAGPYTTIGATLKNENGDSIATSSAQNDSGVFELAFRDERYLPFERVSLDAPSKWTFQMGNSDDRQFDFNTISDVILHIKYTAKELETEPTNDDYVSLWNFSRLFSVRHDFPREWQELGSEVKNLKINKNQLPFRIKDSENLRFALFDLSEVPSSLESATNTQVDTITGDITVPISKKEGQQNLYLIVYSSVK